MFKLKAGYFVSGISIGLVLLFSFLWSLPDGKLHVVFCDVGQGDGAYIRFPDGRDMVVDGGPDDKILQCLGRHMPFWDRHIDMVAMTHPQKDHMQGLIGILDRYSVDYVVRSDVDNTTVGYKTLIKTIAQKHTPVHFLTMDQVIRSGSTTLSFLWPSAEQMTKAHENVTYNSSSVLGAASTDVPYIGDLNDYSLVFLLSYGNFEVLFTGDADERVEARYDYRVIAHRDIEVLKVPHHGSKTGMTQAFLDAVRPKLAVISVGKNTYGHPSEKALTMLKNIGARILTTQQEGDIEVVSDGRGWQVLSGKKELKGK